MEAPVTDKVAVEFNPEEQMVPGVAASVVKGAYVNNMVREKVEQPPGCNIVNVKLPPTFV